MKTYELGFYNGNPKPFATAEVTFTFAGDKVIGVSCADTPAEIPDLCDQLLALLGGRELLFDTWLCTLIGVIGVKIIREVTTPTTQPKVEATTTSVEDSSQTDSATAGVRNIEPFGVSVADEPEYTGGSVSYYTVSITNPTTEGREPYEAECNDIIEALGMTYAEGNAFKAIWRRCAARTLGKAKAGYKDGRYDAEKVVFFGGRMVAQEKGATE